MLLEAGEVVVPVGIEHCRDSVLAVLPDLVKSHDAVVEHCAVLGRAVLLLVGIGDDFGKKSGVAGFLNVFTDRIDEPDRVIAGVEIKGSGCRNVEVVVCGAVREHLLSDVLEEGPCLGSVCCKTCKDVLKDVSEAESILESGVVAALHSVEVENHRTLVLDPFERMLEQSVLGNLELHSVEICGPFLSDLVEHLLDLVDVGEGGHDLLELGLLAVVVVVSASGCAEDCEALLLSGCQSEVEADD